MSIPLQIGNEIVNYPEEGDREGWGEEATRFAELVAAALENVQNEADILPTTATLVNNQASPINVPGLLFNTGIVLSVEISYFIRRVYDSGASTVSESGKILGNYNGTDFTMSTDAEGDSGVTFSVTSTGQFQYISTNLANHISSEIVFRAKTILEP